MTTPTAHPRAGDVFRTENVIGIVFEEVAVKAVDRTVAGPRGPVSGAMVGEELHLDETTERKTFAPGYGEFLTGAGRDVEALAIAVPTDALAAPVPAPLQRLATSARACSGRSRPRTGGPPRSRRGACAGPGGSRARPGSRH
jgi:hypothetical protein